MHVAVVGGGLQGCCTALALAARGVETTILERADGLLTRTAVANEGKIHLGFMYAGDPGLATARMMMEGALAFAPFFARHLGISADAIPVSAPATYLVHRESQRPATEIAGYAAAVHALLVEASAGRRDAYFGQDLDRTPDAWARGRLGATFDDSTVSAAFDTPEVAINPVELALAVRSRIEAEPRIAVRTGCRVSRLDDGGTLVESDGPDGPCRESFDHVVNAAWEGRLAIDASLGLLPTRPWLHRLKYGVSFRLPESAMPPPSCTIILGPFGEVVRYADGLVYLTWYPDCVRALSHDVHPPEWETRPGDPLCMSIAEGTLAALAAIVPELRALGLDDLRDLHVKGGAIVAWGATDIDDPQSELHHRFEIGVSSRGRYHSIDPGKLTMVPLFAEECAARITAGA